MNIEKEMLELLNNVESLLTGDDVSNIRDLIINNECGVGLEVLCTQLEEYQKYVNAYDFSKIKAMAKKFRLKDSVWSGLSISN